MLEKRLNEAALALATMAIVTAYAYCVAVVVGFA